MGKIGKEIPEQIKQADIIKQSEDAREKIYDLICTKLGFEKKNKSHILPGTLSE